MMHLRGTSSYNLELIDKRLEALRKNEDTNVRNMDERSRREEIAYLVNLRRRKFPDAK